VNVVSRKEELERILREGKGERKALSYLADNPEVVAWSVCKTTGHSVYVLKEFPLGNQFKADFVVPYSQSGSWTIHFIEIEPPDDHIINKDGTPSKRLNKALSQTSEWSAYIQSNPVHVRQDLARFCKERDLLGRMDRGKEPTNNTCDRLADPDTFIWYRYYIFIGNRMSASPEVRKQMNQRQSMLKETRLLTFGRFLDVAGNLDSANNPSLSGSIYLPQSEE
jgi:hypothetical protein